MINRPSSIAAAQTPVRVRSQEDLRNFTILVVVLYPFKGLFNIPFYLVFGDTISANLLTPVMALVMAGLVALNFLANHRASHLRTIDLVLLVIGCILLPIALLRDDMVYLNILLLLMVAPVLMTSLSFGSDAFFKRSVTAFFVLVVAYMSIEHVVLHTHLYRLTDSILVSTQDLAGYQSILAYGSNYDLSLAQIIDYRGAGTPFGELGRLRTGGFVANAIRMSLILSLASTYFYVLFRETGSRLVLVPAIAGIFLLFNSVSVTSVSAFLLTVAFYEVYYRQERRNLLVPLLSFGIVVALVLVYDPVSYLFRRTVGAFDILVVDYTTYNPLTWESVFTASVGYQNWSAAHNYLFSSNALINMFTTMGFIPAFLALRRLVGPAFAASGGNSDSSIYAMVVLTAVLGLVHNDSVFSINSFLLVILLNTKANAIIGSLRTGSDNVQRSLLRGPGVQGHPSNQTGR